MPEELDILARIEALEAAQPDNAYRRKAKDGHHHNEPVEGMDDEVSQGFGYQLNAIGGLTLTRAAWPNSRRLDLKGGGMMNVDYVVDPAGGGSHTTMTSALATAKAAGGDKTIWVCSSPAAEDAVDLGGLGGNDLITITSHSKYSVTLTAKANDDLIKQDTDGGQGDGGLRFVNIGLTIPTADKAVFFVNTANQINHLQYENCQFNFGAIGSFSGYLLRMTGSSNGLDAMGLEVTGCTGTAQGLYKSTGGIGHAPTVYFNIWNNYLSMQEFWDGGGNNATPSTTNVAGGFYTLQAGTTFSSTPSQQHFSDFYAIFAGAQPLFTTIAGAINGDDHSYTDIRIQFEHNDGSFGNFGSAGAGGNMDSLFIDGVFGYANGANLSGGTFLTIDTDWLNVHVGNIHAPDFGTLYSGPSTPMGVPMTVVPTFEVEGNADALNHRMILIDATGTAWAGLAYQRSGTDKAAIGMWSTDGETEFGANDLWFAVNDGSWHDVAGFKNDGTVFELNTALNVEGWARIGGDHATSPGNTTDGDLTFVRAFVNNDSNFFIAIVSSNPRFTADSGDYSEFNRAGNYFTWVIGSTEYMRLNATKLDLLNSAYLDANDVQLPLIGSPTYTHVEHLNTVFHSTGWFSGGAISDAGGATINVTAGTGAIRATDSQVAQLLFFDWSASNGLAITANSIRYIGVEYNAGSPQVVVRTSNNFDFNTDFPLGTVVNEGGTLHVQNAPWEIGDHADFMIQRMRGTAPIARDKEVGGLIFSETGTRNVAVTAGQLWRGLTPFVIAALDTDPGGAADTFDTYSAGGSEATGVAAWPNTQYDNAGTLTNMTTNRWANLWWYLELDGELVMVYGTAQYTSAALAGEEAAPSTLPNRLQVHGILAARFIFQKSAATAEEILSAFDTPFAVLGVTDHGNLAGLADVATDHPHGPSAHTEGGNWKVPYTDGSGDEQELALGADDTILESTGASSAPVMRAHEHSMGATIENPSSSEDFTIKRIDAAITVQEIHVVLRGSATPSVTWTIRHQPAGTGSGRGATGNEVVTGGTTTTSVTAGDDVTSFNDATIPADSFVWLETTAKSGTVNELHVTIRSTFD